MQDEKTDKTLAPGPLADRADLAAWVIPILGIFFLRMCDWALLGSFSASYDIAVRFVSRLVQALALVAVLIVDRYGNYSADWGKKVFAGVTALYVMAIAAMQLVGGDEMHYCAGIAHGVFQAVALVCWGFLMCSIDFRRSSICITGGFALYSLGAWALSSMPPALVGLLAMVAPIAAIICFFVSIRRIDVPFSPDGPFSLEAVPTRLVALMALCTVTSCFVHLLIPTARAEAELGYGILCFVADAVIFGMFFTWVFVLKRKDPASLWPVFAVVILGGLIGFTAFVNVDQGVAVNLLTATQTCVLSFVWVQTCGAIQAKRLPRVFTFALSVLVFTQPITLIINAKPLLAPDAVTASGEIAVVVAVLCVTIAFIAICLVMAMLDDARKPRAIEIQLQPAPPSTLEMALEKVAGSFHLTERESEVALYLARGYTLPQTAQTLCVSVDTVRSHVKRLYQKLDIHKKQQLIELLESQMEKDAAAI